MFVIFGHQLSAGAYAEPGGTSFPFGLVRAPWLKTQFPGLGGPARTYRKAKCRSTRHLDEDIRNHKHSVGAAFGRALVTIPSNAARVGARGSIAQAPRLRRGDL